MPAAAPVVNIARMARVTPIVAAAAVVLLIAVVLLSAKLLTRAPAQQWKFQSDTGKHDVVLAAERRLTFRVGSRSS